MFVLIADGLSKEFNGTFIFENVNIEISEGQHVGLIGTNGSGKTTLFQLLLGKLHPEKGSITRRYPVESWGMIEQNLMVDKEWTLMKFMRAENQTLDNLKEGLVSYEEILSRGDISKDEEMSYNLIYEQFLNLDGYQWEYGLEQQLKKFGFSEAFWHQPFEQLSGGQKTLAQLAKLLLKQPKIILLDEPTNHIDLNTKERLVHWMKGFDGTLLTISHDRYFLDQTVDVIYEITPSGTTRYKGGYTEYKQQRDLAYKTVVSQYHKQEKERKKLKEIINKFNVWYNRAHNNAGERNPYAKKKATKHMTRLKSKEKALERLEASRIQKPKEENKVQFTLDSGSFDAKTLLKLHEVNFAYQVNHNLLKDITFSVQREDHIGILGKNGSGKTTLLNIINRNLHANSGDVYYHPALRIGYLKQELDNISLDQTILEILLEIPNMDIATAHTVLANFLFRKDEVYKKISDLSMGERCRVAFVKLYFSEANLLILDEPTNYLDIATREIIEDVLAEYQGSVIIVSHDHYLLAKTTNKIIDLEDGFIVFDGGYLEYQESKKEMASPLAIDIKNEIAKLQLEITALMNQDSINGMNNAEIMDGIKERTIRIDRLKMKSTSTS